MAATNFYLKAFQLVTETNVHGSWQIKDRRLQVRYEIDLAPSQLIWPDAADDPEFRDELWRSTCLELFYGQTASPAYLEWNFSPSGHWACYEFADYRRLVRRAKDRPAMIRSGQSESQFWLEADIPFDPAADLELHLCAILADPQQQSFWSLHHPGTKPDFHHRQSFILKL